MHIQMKCARPANRPFIERLESRQFLSADLTGAFTGKIPAALTLSGKNHLTVDVFNQGDANAVGPVTVSLFVSTGTTLDGADVPLLPVRTSRVNLKPSKGKTLFPMSFSSPTGVPDGNYFILAEIAPSAGIGDSDLVDKVIATPTTVAIRQAFVDLTGAVVKAPTGTLSIGGKRQKPVTLSALVTNNGNVTAHGPLAVSFYAAADQTLTLSHTLLATTPAQVITIPAGLSRRISLTLKLGADVPSGSFFIVADVNSNNGIAESDTTNNLGASGTQVTINNPLIPTGPQLGSALESDVSTVVVGTPELVNFNVTVSQADSSTTVEVDEFDASGNNLGLFTNLFDDGNQLNGDQTAGDGIYSGINTIGFVSPGTRYFAAVIRDPLLPTPAQTATISIAGVNAASQAQLQTDAGDSASINQVAQNVLSGGGSGQDALNAATNALQSDSNVMPGSIATSTHAVEWRTLDGITEGFDLDAQTGSDLKSNPTLSPAPAQPRVLTPLDTTTPDATKTAICISPFNYAFSLDEVPVIANMLTNNGYTVTTAINASSTDTNVSIDTFKNLGQYGAIVIGSHGDQLPESGEGILTGIKASYANELANLGDLYNGRLVVISGYLTITPKFIRTYAGSMNDSIVYVGACFSTFDDKMANAFIGRGADAYLGYSDEVGTRFSASEGVAAFTTLLMPTNNTVMDIPGINTIADPNAPHAVFGFRGNPAATLPQAGLLANSDVYVRYDWPQNETDLDSSTGFLGTTAGYDQPGGTYLNWSGDNTGSGGDEITTVDIYSAYQAQAWSGSTTITAAADWYQPSGGSGPALLTVALENKTTGKLTNVITRSINPNFETNGATTLVGTITVTLGGDPANPTVILTLS